MANLDRVYQTVFACDNVNVPCADYLGNGDVSAQVLDYILYTQRDTGGNEQESITANVTGSLFDLPAGPLGFAAGVERREESGWRDPDPLVVANLANTNQQDAIAGHYEVDEVYAEFVVPLVHGLTGVEHLELSLAGRYSDYDLFGDDTNYKAGLLWQIAAGFKVRASRSTAFRIPNIPELFGRRRGGQPHNDRSLQRVEPTQSVRSNLSELSVGGRARQLRPAWQHNPDDGRRKCESDT